MLYQKHLQYFIAVIIIAATFTISIAIAVFSKQIAIAFDLRSGAIFVVYSLLFWMALFYRRKINSAFVKLDELK